MFIELHNTDGEPFLLNTDLIISVGKKEDGGSVFYVHEIDSEIVAQESYRDILNVLPEYLSPKAYKDQTQEIDGVPFISIVPVHTCESCGHTWTGYDNSCPKCGKLCFVF